MYKMSEKPLIRADEIRERVATLAREIVDVYDYDILLSALTGAYMFTADLNRELAKAQGAKAYNKAIAFIKASSYGNSTTSSGKLQVRGLEKSPDGRRHRRHGNHPARARKSAQGIRSPRGPYLRFTEQAGAPRSRNLGRFCRF